MNKQMIIAITLSLSALSINANPSLQRFASRAFSASRCLGNPFASGAFRSLSTSGANPFASGGLDPSNDLYLSYRESFLLSGIAEFINDAAKKFAKKQGLGSHIAVNEFANKIEGILDSQSSWDKNYLINDEIERFVEQGLGSHIAANELINEIVSLRGKDLDENVMNAAFKRNSPGLTLFYAQQLLLDQAELNEGKLKK
jgi:hypothetical protein